MPVQTRSTHQLKLMDNDCNVCITGVGEGRVAQPYKPPAESEFSRGSPETATEAALENVTIMDIDAGTDGPKRFLVGDLVEVRMREKGLRGSWHPAKVVEVLERMRRVEYEELVEDDEVTRLRELIPVGRASDGDNLMGTLPLKSPPKKLKPVLRPVLRPRPPPHPETLQTISWQEGVWVECFFEDAWWEGILAENITTTVNVVDVAQITRKSEVDVFFPEEDDISKMSVKLMRIGQEWDEQTGNWSVKGCAPVPVVKPKRKPSKKSIDPKSAEVVIESKLFENPLAMISIVDNDDTVEDSYSKGYGYEERLHMFHLNGFNVGSQEPLDSFPSIDESPMEEHERGLKATDDGVPIEQVDVQLPVGSDARRAAQNEEAAEKLLKSIGWRVTKSRRTKTGEVIWKCKSPRVTGSPVKIVSSLVEALSTEAQRGTTGSNVQEATSLSQTSFPDEKDHENWASVNSGIGEYDENDDYAASARQILKRFGWDVSGSRREGFRDAWFYRTPEAGAQPRKWFTNWRQAIEEYVKQKEIASKQEASASKQKKGGGRGQDSSPVPTPRRVTRRLSMPEDAKSTPEDAKKSANGAGPSIVRSKKERNSAGPEIILGQRDHSDVDDNEKRELKIGVNSGRKRTAVDPGQNFVPKSISPTSMNSYLEKPFGSVASFTQNSNAYVLHVITNDFVKEQISATVEKNDMLIKARYVVEERFNNIPVRCNGSVSARMTLPNDIEREKITAEFKSPFLIFTLPKSLTAPEDVIEIKIQ